MVNRISWIPEAKRALGGGPTVKIILLFALGFMVVCQQATLGAQVPAQGSKPDPSASVLPGPSANPSPASTSDEYLINPGDVLDVYVYDVPELSHTYTVSPSGVIIGAPPTPASSCSRDNPRTVRSGNGGGFSPVRALTTPGNRRLYQAVTRQFGGGGGSRKESANGLRDGTDQTGRYFHPVWWISR